ncbi:MAG: hypothetical protein V8S72_04410 [Oscillospiraceae bacterium]
MNEAFLRGAEKPVGIALERAGGEMAAVETRIHGTPEMYAADCYFIDRLVKTMLWMKGGYKYLRPRRRADIRLSPLRLLRGRGEGVRLDYMANVFERPFEVVQMHTLPAAKDLPKAIGGHMDGCRIGFDAGGNAPEGLGSDKRRGRVHRGGRLVPEINSDPDYHYAGIVAALKSAAEHMPRVDAVGVSSAGIYINNRTMNASLFLKVPKVQFDAKVKDIYIRAITDTFGDVPYSVVNDGDVTALAGAMSLKENNILGIAMGTSEAAGFVDAEGRITGWLNELAFVPVDANLAACTLRMERRYRLRREIFFTGRCQQARAQSRNRA